MGKRINIIINYQYDENWIGGTYYVQNLIHALQLLKDSEKPFLHIKSNDVDAISNLFSQTKYPYLVKYTPYSSTTKWHRGLNKISRIILKKNIYSLYKKFDVEFPASLHEVTFTPNKLFWIPDFQEKYLPQFFTEEEIEARHRIYTRIRDKANNLVFSSKDAQKDFNKYYSDGKPAQYVLNFATYHTNSNLPEIQTVLAKFSINQDYFLCSNQFWAHKNHIIVIKAIAELKNQSINILVVFTGKEHDYRNPEYFSELSKEIDKLDIKENVKFLGFIDREDQIVLLKNCKAVIQPSLFEGWSTVNEDAKAENVYILSSNLEVNKEQLQDYPNARFFDPGNEKDLARKIKENNFEISKFDYTQSVRGFGENFLQIVKNVKQKK